MPLSFHPSLPEESLALTDQLHLGSARIKVETSLSTGCLGPLALRRIELHDFVSAAHPSLENRIESFRSKGDNQ